MMNLGKLLVLVLILNACVSDNQMITIDQSFVFHSNTSKVWLVIHKYKNGKDFSPLSNKYKEILIFHKSGNFYMQKMNTLGDEIGQKGTFSVSENFNNVRFDFDKTHWNFALKMLSDEKIILKPISNYEYSLELIPIPEP
jgi:hypothetical protein